MKIQTATRFSVFSSSCCELKVDAEMEWKLLERILKLFELLAIIGFGQENL